MFKKFEILMKEIYLDYASATALDPRVKQAMEPYWSKAYGNPSSLHELGREAKLAVRRARKSVASLLKCRPSEVIFTAGGTEADNIAVFGIAGALGKGKAHFITTAVEHHAVLDCFKALEEVGHRVTFLGVSKDGLVDARSVDAAIRPDTVLISVAYANSEIGVIQPIREISRAVDNARKNREKAASPVPLYFHSDASQAAGFLDLNVDKLGVDLLTLNGAKIYGPKGVGALFVSRSVILKPVVFGGGQEKSIRSGTENVPAIVGMARALELVERGRAKESARLTKLRDYFIGRLLKVVPDAALNGHAEKRLPNNINISIPGIESETVVLFLDQKGIYASTGSACTSEAVEPSYVVTALGKPLELAAGSLRFTMGRGTTKKDVDYVIKVLPGILKKLIRHE